MTFEEFQSTGRAVNDLGAETGDDSLSGISGRIFHGDLWMALDGPALNWWTIIGNSTYRSPVTSHVERKLYQFLCDQES